MSEWQPAIINIIHEGYDKERAKRLHGQRVRVKESPNGMTGRAADCDAERFFVIHPDDVTAIAPWRVNLNAAICEHEILTD